MKLLTKHTKDTHTHKFLKTRQCSGKNGSGRWFYLAFPPITWMGYWEHACHPLFCLPYSHLFQKQTFIELTDCSEGNTHLSSKGTGEWHSQTMPLVARLSASWWSFPPFISSFCICMAASDISTGTGHLNKLSPPPFTTSAFFHQVKEGLILNYFPPLSLRYCKRSFLLSKENVDIYFISIATCFNPVLLGDV